MTSKFTFNPNRLTGLPCSRQWDWKDRLIYSKNLSRQHTRSCCSNMCWSVYIHSWKTHLYYIHSFTFFIVLLLLHGLFSHFELTYFDCRCWKTHFHFMVGAWLLEKIPGFVQTQTAGCYLKPSVAKSCLSKLQNLHLFKQLYSQFVFLLLSWTKMRF